MSIKRLGYKIEFVEGRHSKPNNIMQLTELNSWLVKADIDAENDNNGRGYDKCYIDVIYQVDNKKYAVHGIRTDLGDGSDPKIYEKDLKWADDKINDFVKTGNAGYGTIRPTDKKTVKDSFTKNDYNKLMDFLFANKYRVVREVKGTKDGDSIEVYRATKEKNGKGLLFRYNRTKDIVEMAVYSDLATQSHAELNNLDEVKLRLKDSKLKDVDPLVQEVANVIKGIASIFDMSEPLKRAGFKVEYYDNVMWARKHGKRVVVASKNRVETDSNDIVQGNYVIGIMDSAIKDADRNKIEQVIESRQFKLRKDGSKIQEYIYIGEDDDKLESFRELNLALSKDVGLCLYGDILSVIYRDSIAR